MCQKVPTTRRNEMQTIDEVREHCRFVGKGFKRMFADGESPNEYKRF